jgi:hypothetical protein
VNAKEFYKYYDSAPPAPKMHPKHPQTKFQESVSGSAPQKPQPSATKSSTGYVWIKEQQRPFTQWTEIARGKNKGMVRVTVAGKNYLVDKGKVRKWPGTEEVKTEERPARTDQIGDQYKAQQKAVQEPIKETDTFTDGMLPMQAKRVNDALDRSIQHNGKLTTRRAMVKALVDDGATIVEKNGERRLQRPNGNFLIEKDISKTAMDYADHLIKQESRKQAIDKEVADLNIQVDAQRENTRESLKKDHPDWSAQRIENELAKAVRSGEEAGISEAEAGTKPVKKRLFEKKAVNSEVSPARKTEPKPRLFGKGKPFKDPSTMTPSEINKELDSLDARDSKNADAMIKAGRGHERFTDIRDKTDALSMEWKNIAERRFALRNEIELRYGPDAPSRLPKGFGARKERASEPKTEKTAKTETPKPEPERIQTKTVDEFNAAIDNALKKAPEIDAHDASDLKIVSRNGEKKRSSGFSERDLMDQMKEKYGVIKIQSPNRPDRTYTIINTKYHIQNFKDTMGAIQKKRGGKTLFRKGTPQGLPLQSIQQAIDPIASKWKNAPAIKVVQSTSELPGAIRKQIGEGDVVAGAFHDDTVYIVADHTDNAQDAQRTILHEVIAHWGLRKTFGPDLDTLLRRIYRNMDRNTLKDIADRYGYDLTNREDQLYAVEEYMASVAEMNKKPPVWNRLVAWVRQRLRSMGFTVDMSGNDVDMMIADALGKARKYVEGGKSPAVSGFRDGRAQYKIIAWHGSPHTFDKFSTEKIGTGEGAQAYGHGLYFAGKKEVAQFYKNKLSNPEVKYTLDGKTLNSHFTEDEDLNYYDEASDYIIQKYPPAVAAWLHVLLDEGMYEAKNQIEYGWASDMVHQAKILTGKTITKEDAEQARGVAKQILEKDIKEEWKNAGRLYEVELAPEEDEYLLWDKPLSEQSEKVKDALGLSDEYLSMGGRIDKGRDFYRGLTSGLWAERRKQAGFPETDRGASDYLHSIGIRGIKYLDGTSRGKGEGNYNYVLFSDEDVTTRAMFRKKSLFDKRESGKNEPVTSKKGPGEKPTEATPKPDGGNPFKESMVQEPVYHGSNEELPITDFKTKRVGYYFSPNSEVSDQYGYVHEYYLNSPKHIDLRSEDGLRIIDEIEKDIDPEKIIDSQGDKVPLREIVQYGDWSAAGGSGGLQDSVLKEIRSRGYTGVTMNDFHGGGENEVAIVVFDKKNIKPVKEISIEDYLNPNQSRPSGKGGSVKFRVKSIFQSKGIGEPPKKNKASLFARNVARAIQVRPREILKKEAPQSSKEPIRKYEQTISDERRFAGNWMSEFDQSIEGLSHADKKWIRENFKDAYENGVRMPNPRIQRFMQAWDKIQNEIGDKAIDLGIQEKYRTSEYVVKKGTRSVRVFDTKEEAETFIKNAKNPEGLEMTSRDAVKVRPFTKIRNYFPHTLTPEAREALRTQRGEVFDALQEKAHTEGFDLAPYMEDVDIKNMVRRNANLENARQARLPNFVDTSTGRVQILETNPFKVLPNVIEGASRRLAFAKNWGPKPGEALKMHEEIRNSITRESGSDNAFVWDYLWQDMQGRTLDEFFEGMTGDIKGFLYSAEAISRGLMLSSAQISNIITGPLPGMIKFGAWNMTKAGARLISQKLAKRLGVPMPETEALLEQFRREGGWSKETMKVTGETEDIGKSVAGIADIFLKKTGMEAANRFLNKMSNFASHYALEDAIEGLRKPRLGTFRKAWGMDPKGLKEFLKREGEWSDSDIDRIIKNGLTEEDHARFIQKSSTNTNVFMERANTRPSFMKNGFWRRVFSYTSYYRMMGSVVADTMKYAKEGNYRPLITLLLAAPVLGMAEKHLKEYLKGVILQADEKKDEALTFAGQLLDAIAGAGALGFPGAMLSNLKWWTKRGGAPLTFPQAEWWGKVTYGMYNAVVKGIEKSPDEGAKQAYYTTIKNVPIFRVIDNMLGGPYTQSLEKYRHGGHRQRRSRSHRRTSR